MANLQTIRQDLQAEGIKLMKACVDEQNVDQLRRNVQAAVDLNRTLAMLDKVAANLCPFEAEPVAMDDAAQARITKRVQAARRAKINPDDVDVTFAQAIVQSTVKPARPPAESRIEAQTKSEDPWPSTAKKV